MLTIFISMIDDPEDQTKFEKIYNKYHNDMIKIAYSITKKQYIAEEVVQDSLYIIVKNINRIKIDSDEMLKSYVYKLVKNTALNTMRKEGHIIFTEDIENIDITIDAEKIIDENEAYNFIVRKISSLPGIYRDVLILNIVNGFSSKDIAALLDTKHSTVKSRLSRGMKILKSILEEVDIK